MKDFNDRMLHYASRLFDIKCETNRSLVPIRGLVIIDDIINPMAPILTHSFVTQFVTNK